MQTKIMRKQHGFLTPRAGNKVKIVTTISIIEILSLSCITLRRILHKCCYFDFLEWLWLRVKGYRERQLSHAGLLAVCVSNALRSSFLSRFVEKLSGNVWSMMDRLEPERRRMRRPPTGTIFTWWRMRTGRKSLLYSVLYATRFSSARTMLVVWLPKYDRTWTRRFIRAKVTSVKLEKEN